MGDLDRLTQLEAWWSSIWKTAPAAIIIAGEKGRVEDCSPEAERMFAYSRAELLGMDLNTLVPESQALFAAPGHCPGLGIQREFDGQRKDGSSFPAFLSVGAFSLAGKDGSTVIVQDISERKLIEERLRQREEQLSLTIRFAPTGICTVDLSGNFLTVNEAFCSMVGYTESELVRKPVNSITHPDDVERAELRLRQLRAGEIEQYRVKKRYITKAGGVVEAIMTAGVVHGSAGEPLLYVAQVEDLTERVEAEREATESRERLAHVTRVQLIGEMAAGIAHEINQPLTAIGAYAQASARMIKAGMLESSEILAAMDKIDRQARRAGDVIHHLRQLVRQRSSAREVTDLNELVAEIVPLAEVDARMHDTSVRLSLADSPLPVTIDPIQIQQVVLNLLRNGMEAMDMVEHDERVLEIRTRRVDGDTAEIAVKDRGVGIPQETEENLFRTFFTTKRSGMGMGLAICRSITRSHDGRLWFTRNERRGATFHLSLPITDGGSDEHE